MIIAWIVITIMLGLVVGIIAAGILHREAGFGADIGFLWGFGVTVQLSGLAAIVYVAAHFITKYW